MKTNEEAKQEAIKAAWGDKYDEVKNYLDLNGRFNCGYKPHEKLLFVNIYRHAKRSGWTQLEPIVPNDLLLIKENNGWTRIEPDGSNLPATGRFKVCNIDNLIDESPLLLAQSFPVDDVGLFFAKGYITHYKPIKEEPKPIY